MRLHDYWRSGAACYVRVDLAPRSVPYEQVTPDLWLGQLDNAACLARNLRELDPALQVDDMAPTQSPPSWNGWNTIRRCGCCRRPSESGTSKDPFR